MENNFSLMDGKATALEIRKEVKEKIESKIKLNQHLRSPKLAVLLIGDRTDSSTYVSMKEKACKECGIDIVIKRLSSEITQMDAETATKELNSDPNIDGLIVQLPLPNHIDEPSVLRHLSCEKDIDGLHPLNLGKLALKGSEPLFKPCTALGCLELCKRYKIDLEGKHVVILGRSNIVGLPSALLFLQENSTVTICHSRTKNISEECKKADVLVAAIGKPQFVKSSFLKPGAVVIDVGINSITDSTRKSGFRLVGDVDFEECKSKCTYITPVPGGVGPMTVAILMYNIQEAWQRNVDEVKSNGLQIN